jgi:hypothetical protein
MPESRVLNRREWIALTVGAVALLGGWAIGSKFSWHHLFDTVYAGTMLSLGFAPGIIGAAASMFLRFRARWPVSAIMLLTTSYAVRFGAHDFGFYLTGYATLIGLQTLGIAARAHRNEESILRQHPYDIAVSLFGTVGLASYSRF